MKGTWEGSGTWKAGGGRGGLVLAVVIAAAITIGSGAAPAAVSALVTILIIFACLAGAAVLAVIAWLVHRARQDRPGRQVQAARTARLPPGPRPPLEGSAADPAIGPAREVHIHLHGLTPGQLAAIVTRSDSYPEEDR